MIQHFLTFSQPVPNINDKLFLDFIVRWWYNTLTALGGGLGVPCNPKPSICGAECRMRPFVWLVGKNKGR